MSPTRRAQPCLTRAARGFLVMALALLLAACATSPTGRRQLKLFNPQRMAAMGDQSYNQLRQKTPIDRNRADDRFVACVAHALTRLPRVADATHGHWRVTVFDSDKINAFALPGGNIGVYSGLLPVTDNGAQLAAVLGHEIGHVLAGHPNERMSEHVAAQSGLSVLSAALGGGSGGAANQMALSALGVGTQVGVLLPFSRAQESEADLIGLRLMARAGFDPHQAVALWHNMDHASGGGQHNAFLSTHPANADRIRNLQAHMSQAMQLYRNAPRHPHCRHP